MIKTARHYRCYAVLALFCDTSHAETDPRGVAEFKGRTFKTCMSQAARVGWKIHTETETATCPDCVRAKKQTRPKSFKVEIKKRRRA